MTDFSNRLTVLQSVVCVAVFVIVGLSVAWRSLDYDWYFDDLHIVRPFSAAEIAGSFTGTWDPDDLETKGFRPGTVIFNDFRARVFGESVRAQRVFLIVLFAAYLVSLGALICRFGAPWWIGLIAGVLTLCSKDSFYHVVWISDGIHLVPGLLFVAAAHLLLGYLDDGRRLPGAASGLLLLVALAAREDALALCPVVLLMGAAYLMFSDRPPAAYRRLASYGAFLVLTFLSFWLWRLAGVPRAPNFRVNLDVLLGPWYHFRWMVSLSGEFGTAQYAFLAAFVVLLAVAVRLPRDQRRHSLMWLVLAAIACLPGAVRARANLLLFPISFYATFVALTVAPLARTSRVAAACALTVLLVAAGVSARASRLEQLSLHPMSANKLYWDWQSIYSDARFSNIPPVRLERLKANLGRFGIVDGTFDFDRWQQSLRQRGRVGFIDDGDAFVPERYFLTP